MKKCKQENCNKIPIFNYEKEKSPIYCNDHKKENMIDVKSKRCLYENCKTQPAFNYENENIKIYCAKHKKPEMINVKNKICLYEKCKKQPAFNYENKKAGLYCFEHKLENMIDVKSKRCLYENCNKRPNFNCENKNTGKYCFEHKLEKMIDVKHKKCLNENCNKRPNFNYENKLPIYCFEHKLENMIDIAHKKCLDENCSIRPIYNYEGNKDPIYCNEHKLENMINIKDKRCKECNIIRVSNPKYKGYCTRCFIYLFPNEKVSRNYKIKEQHIVDFIKDKFSDNEILTFDKTPGGCSNRRPDCYIDKLTHVIVVECDENQHKEYEEICENKRTMELFQDFNSRPIIFIRFNPDAYQKNGKKILSSFKYHKTSGVPMIRNQKEWDNRLKELQNKIEYNLQNIPNKEITIDYLFYDT